MSLFCLFCGCVNLLISDFVMTKKLQSCFYSYPSRQEPRPCPGKHRENRLRKGNHVSFHDGGGDSILYTVYLPFYHQKFRITTKFHPFPGNLGWRISEQMEIPSGQSETLDKGFQIIRLSQGVCLMSKKCIKIVTQVPLNTKKHLMPRIFVWFGMYS